MRIVVVAVAAMIIGGCASSPRDAEREISHQVESHRQGSDRFVAAMKPFLGRWVTDLEATLAENAFLRDEDLDAIRRDLAEYPFELEITDRHYVSHGRIKRIFDEYNVMCADVSGVWIALQSVDKYEK